MPCPGCQHNSTPPEASSLPGSPSHSLRACQRETLQNGRRRCPGCPERRAAAAAAAAARCPCCRAGPEQGPGHIVDGNVVQSTKGGLLAQAAGQPAIQRVERDAGGQEAESQRGRAAGSKGRCSECQRQPRMGDQVGRQQQHLRLGGAASAWQLAGPDGSSSGGCPLQPRAACAASPHLEVASGSGSRHLLLLRHPSRQACSSQAHGAIWKQGRGRTTRGVGTRRRRRLAAATGMSSSQPGLPNLLLGVLHLSRLLWVGGEAVSRAGHPSDRLGARAAGLGPTDPDSGSSRRRIADGAREMAASCSSIATCCRR